METRHNCEINELKSSFEFTKRSVLDSQIRELTVKFNQDKQQFENQIRAQNQKLIESENKIVLITQENERLHFKYNERNEELETLKSKLLQLDLER